MQPAIVIVTYNRPNSLKRLLGSINNANYNGYSNIPLIISIDGGGTGEMLDIAQKLVWQHGEKRIIAHKENLGLRKHVISCGDLSKEYGSVIVLEDDLFVSPYFYDYASQAISFYDEEKKIAGISLITYKWNDSANEFTGLPFIPLQNGYDAFFMQIPSSWGQVWTNKQWEAFKSFYETNPVITEKDKLPDTVKRWPESSWKKFFYKYIVDNNLYFVYPYGAHSTNFGDAGTHFFDNTPLLQVALMNVRKHYSFPQMHEVKIIYDAYMELFPESLWNLGVKRNMDFCVDVYGGKPLELFENEYCFSIKECMRPIEQYGIDLIPIENNIMCGFAGNKISFSKRVDYGKNMVPGTYDRMCQIYDGVVYNTGCQSGMDYVKKTKAYRWGYYSLHPFKLFETLKRKWRK